MLVVVALGGNALIRRGERAAVEVQRRNVGPAAGAVAALARAHHVVLTHGNGPQVGLLALQSTDPLDVLDAESEGMVGYLLEQALGHHLPPDRLATLLTQTVVDPKDPAFDTPTKPIGPTYAAAEAGRLAEERGWTFGIDGNGLRRLVASPEPIDIVELPTVRLLVEAGVVVTCGGGGGIPVVALPSGGYAGIEAVVDKDLFSALLAARLGADALLLLTDVDAVYDGWGTSHARPVACATAEELYALGLPAGSMAPKVKAASRFVAGGRIAAIGALADAVDVLAGRKGTRVVP